MRTLCEVREKGMVKPVQVEASREEFEDVRLLWFAFFIVFGFSFEYPELFVKFCVTVIFANTSVNRFEVIQYQNRSL